MKCLLNPITKEVKRLSNEMAESLVSKGWKFVPKQTWKDSEGSTWAKASTPANPTHPNKVRRAEQKASRPTKY